eukprot:CAMPEP_0174833676 /NCGR_PEP_ID=MMETSP1114-20130205/4381_1 /TAXON_ID=312471 /ORGANISM="Neobodo designis, Strain CCAP 1951/1" /LENGTH=205 /DNA_ID=CAMNT_0016067567 /DNA_START=37 /DNA_END=650 /DNA_ORIENTATION=-
MALLALVATGALSLVPFLLAPVPAGAATLRLALSFVHVGAFAAFFGTTVWVSFIGGLIMFYNLPRHAFGRAQSRLFPAYFRWSAVELAAALASLHLLRATSTPTVSTDALTSTWALRAALALSLVNLLILEPRTTAVMFKRHAVENRLNPDVGREVPTTMKPTDAKVTKDSEWQRLTKRFGALHGMSTLVNMASFAAGLAHVYVL